MCSKPEEAAAEPEPQRRRRFGLEEERRVVQAQLLERVAKLGDTDGLSTGYSPANTIGLSSLKPGNGVAAGRLVSVIVSPIFASPTFLMFATTKPTSPAAELVDRLRLGREHADLLGFVVLALGHQPDLRSLASACRRSRATTMTTPR